MNKRENELPKFFILPIIIAIILIISLAGFSYGFYQFARIVVTFLSAVYLYFAYTQEGKFRFNLIPNILIVILWNPILPIYLEEDTWIILDFVMAIIEIIVAIYAYRLRKKKPSKNNTSKTDNTPSPDINQQDTEITKAFEFYINWYQEIVDNAKLLKSQENLKHMSDIKFYMMQRDLSALKNKDIKTLFAIMMKKDMLEYQMLKSQISKSIYYRDDVIDMISNINDYKPPYMTTEEYIEKLKSSIKINDENIIRLKAYDIDLCEELMLAERES